ncbi:Protein OS-9 [Entomortierella beljakovae]|nr:Protein OS-9 [Entomortierella beljakovae]
MSSSMVMTDADGQKWVCSIPKTQVQVEIPEPEKTPEEIENETRQSVARGLELLDHLTGECLLSRHEYWTYEYCHKVRIRQFHAHNVNGRWEPVSKASTHVLATYDSSGLETQSKDNDPKSSSVSKIEATTELKVTNERKYLVQQWGNGDNCDLTGVPRKVEVQFQCANVDKRIQLITEPSICTYIMVIYSPALCTDVAFELIPAPEANKIDCRPVVSDEQYQQRKVASQGAIEDGLGTQDSNGQIKFNQPLYRANEKSSIGRGTNTYKEMAALIDKVQAATRRKQFDDFLANLDEYIVKLEPYLTKEQLDSIRNIKNQADGKVHIIDEDTGPLDLESLLGKFLGAKNSQTKEPKKEKEDTPIGQSGQAEVSKEKKKAQTNKQQEIFTLILDEGEDNDNSDSDLKNQISRLESIFQKLDATKKESNEQRKKSDGEDSESNKKDQRKAHDKEQDL